MIEAINIMAYYECNSGTKDFELVLSINFALCRREGTTGTFYPSRTNTLDTTIVYINEKITITNTTANTVTDDGYGSTYWIARIESIVIKSFKLL